MKVRVLRSILSSYTFNDAIKKVRKVAEKHWCDLVHWNEDHDLATDEDGNEYLIVEDKDGLHILDFDGLILRNFLDIEDFIDSVAEIRHYGTCELEMDFELNAILFHNLQKFFSPSYAEKEV